MKGYLESFFKTFAYSEEAKDALLSAYEKIVSASADEFSALLTAYDEDMRCDFKLLLAGMKEISAKADVSQYAGDLILFICLSKRLRQYYADNQIDDSIWLTSIADLKYKAIECKLVYGEWGSFVAEWFIGFFHLERFGFENLQFEVIDFGYHFEKDGISLTPSSKALNIHIPRTGKPLDQTLKAKAYRDAKEFFIERGSIQGPKVAFVCSCWLLYPINKTFLKPESNLYSFISDFEIIHTQDNADYSNLWRLFDRNFTHWSELPQDTSFRRAYVNLIKNNQKTGWSVGVFVL